MLHILLFLLYLEMGLCLWPKGIVHYAINSKDYDLHSQDIITSTLADIEKEVCVKFFSTAPSFSATKVNKILYINNPQKRKTCPSDHYNYTGSVVDMPIGYKCMTTKEISRIVVDVLRASIEQSPASAVNSNDLVKKFQEMDEDPTSSTLLSPRDRNYINLHYHRECGPQAEVSARRSVDVDVRLTEDNEGYYKDKLWPLGMVMYGVDKNLLENPSHRARLLHLEQAMSTVELASCVVFQQLSDDVLRARSLLWFAEEGLDAPALGFMQGNQTISLSAMTDGAPGHTAHTLNLLLRALGVHMESNSHDRDYYVTVHWNNVIKGKEHYVEKMPLAARVLPSLGYDFDSATHAPANYVCKDCSRGQATIVPAQEQLWQRTLSMGRSTSLSAADSARLRALYHSACRDRYRAHSTR